ncbi:MAG: CaiB/BaiF CoA transferase family protein [Alphaproteobacteria bacterium]
MSDDCAFAGLKVLEFGGGAAGPIAVRHLADHGATVVRVESRARPDFLRLLAQSARNRDLDAAPFFTMLNCNKLSVALDLNDPRGVALAHRMVDWCDVLAENFAPRAMRKWGLDWDSLSARRPDLVMVSTCLMGQTGPHKDYPGFGGQGSAISGFNFLTGWPDREAVGQYGTITDSLAPRYSAAAVVAALLRRKRTGQGCHLDVAQTETAAYALSGWMLEWTADGTVVGRDGNRSRFACPHGAFPCRGEDRWCTIACHDDGDWRRLVAEMGSPGWASDRRFATLAGRKAAEDEIEARIAEWTRDFDRGELFRRLQAAGLDAGVVETCADLHEDPQLRHRGHFVPMHHAVIGEHPVERLGYELSETPARIERPGPRLGEHGDRVWREFLGLSDEEIETLARDGVLR